MQSCELCIDKEGLLDCDWYISIKLNKFHVDLRRAHLVEEILKPNRDRVVAGKSVIGVSVAFHSDTELMGCLVQVARHKDRSSVQIDGYV